jgi:uridine kinase
MTTPERALVLEILADAVTRQRRPHPLRVAIDGIDAAGKSVLADELATLVVARGWPVIRASIDGFHRPREERYRLGPDSPEGYYRDSFDYDALRRELLDPLGPGGDRNHRTAVFDFEADRPVEMAGKHADSDAVLLFEGVFLLRPELDGVWDLTVFVEVSFDEALRRARQRDQRLFGSAPDVEDRYLTRYLPGQRLYLRECRPERRADYVLANDHPDRPQLVERY